MTYQLSRGEATAIALKIQPVAKASGWSKSDQINREEWLTQVAKRDIAPLIAQCDGKPLGKYRVSVGWPKGSRGGKGAESIGQCWDHKVSADGHYELFISPVLGAFEAVEVLIHELVHVSDKLASKHKGEFKRLATALGLEGKMTATKAGEDLAKKIRAWLADMPPFPHGPMTQVTGAGKDKKPGSRLLKACCEECGYTVRVTAMWVDVAPPVCPNPDCDRQHEPVTVE